MFKNPTLIEKESIPDLTFKNKISVEQSPQLFQNLANAASLGNIHHRKVTIIFEDDESVKQVNTTIWCTGQDYICLKGGVWIPISRIHDVII
ncbi:MAG: hypothetical protein WC994_01780 [Brumimicrobium sp.]